MVSRVPLLGSALVLLGAASSAQVVEHVPTSHDAMLATAEVKSAADPVEAGQSAYSALGETVRILLADPDTNWSAVDVDALREHLIDMNNVTLSAHVTKTRLSNGALFRVTGQGPVRESIRRMTTSHFAQPDFGRPWTMRVQPTAVGADVTVVSANQKDAAEIYGLGFFGILTMGVHHPPHHLMMARGMMRH